MNLGNTRDSHVREKRKLCDYIILKENGEIKIRRRISMDIREQLCIATKSENYDDVYKKLRRDAKVRIKLQNCHHKEIFSINRLIVRHWTRWLSLTSVPGLYSDLDLDRGKYEGGFKVWEATADLIQFLTKDQSVLMNRLLYDSNSLNVLELGAGAALPTLSLLSRLVGDRKFQKPYRIHIQDYNWQVLVSLSLLNFSMNFPLDFFEALLKTRCLRFFYGDWSRFSNPGDKYNLIIMSEVIYNSDSYEALHNLLANQLDESGYILLATKNTYFGLSGSAHSWLEFINSKRIFHLQKQFRISASNIPRSLLIFTRIGEH